MGASDQVVEHKSQFLIAANSVSGCIQAEVGTFWRVDGIETDPLPMNIDGDAVDDCCVP